MTDISSRKLTMTSGLMSGPLTLASEHNSISQSPLANRSRIRSFSVFDQKSALLRHQEGSLTSLSNSFLNVPGMNRSNSIMLSPHPPDHRRLPHSPCRPQSPRGYGHFQSPSVSNHGSFLDVRSSLNSSNSSITSSFHPSTGRRRLPVAPDEYGKESPRRCSSPRVLPISPCHSPIKSPSPPFSNNYNNHHPHHHQQYQPQQQPQQSYYGGEVQRRPSHRRLPEPPSEANSFYQSNYNAINSSNSVSPIPSPILFNANSSNEAINTRHNPYLKSNHGLSMQTPLKKSSCIAPPPNIADLLKPRRNSANHQPNLLPSVSPSSPRDTPVIISQNDTPISTVSNSPNPLSQQPTISKSDSSTYGNNGSVYNDSRRSSIAQDRDAFRFRNGSMAHLFEQQHLIHMRDKSPSRNSNLTLESQHSTEQLNSFASSKSGSIIEKDDDGTVSTIGSISSSGSATAPLTAACNKKPENLGLDPSHYTGLLSKENKPETVILSASGQQIMPGTEECRKKGLGLVTCTLQHFPVRKRFRVTVIKVEGLAGELKPDMELLPFCRVSLAPAKNSKAQDSAVKRGRDVAFNQEFFFDNVAVEDLENKTITVVFLHQPAAKLQKETEIGEFSIELKDFPLLTTKKEVKIVDELKVKFNSKVVKEAKTLTINLNKVEDLPKWGLCGAPDVCVRVSVTQADGKVQTKQSRVLKNTCKAVYQESIMFLISTKVGDLRKTQITISAIDMQRHGTGDDVIGSSYLGSIAMDKSEVEQWKNTIEHLGKEYKASHHLKLDLPVTREYIDEKETNNNVKKDEFSDELFDSEDLLK